MSEFEVMKSKIQHYITNPNTVNYKNFTDVQYMPKDIIITNDESIILFKNNSTDFNLTSKNIFSSKIKQYSICFHYDNINSIDYKYTYFEMYVFENDNIINESITNDIIELIQKDIREQNTSLSSVFIIGKNNNTQGICCIFYPILLEELCGQLDINAVNTELTKNMIENYR